MYLAASIAQRQQAAIAEAMNVPYEDVMTWSEHNLGFGEIARAYLLAHEAGVDVWEILQNTKNNV